MHQAEVPVLLVPATAKQTLPTDRAPRILVPLDGSPLAEEVLDRAGQLAEQLGAELHLLQVVEPPHYGYAEAFPMIFNPEAELAEARRYLESVAGKLPAARTAPKLHTDAGNPPIQIAMVAHEHGIDLIAMATHGRGGLSRVVLGSVALGTLQRADVTQPEAARSLLKKLRQVRPTLT